jgi:5-methylcytosine-specific restriction endonuclease McrA
MLSEVTMAHSEETKAKIRAAWVERRKTFVPPMKGKQLSEETRQKISTARKGKPSGRLGIRHTVETRIKISERTRERAWRGDQLPQYKDGQLAERRGQRFSGEYKRWRFDVFARDHFTCQECGDARGGNLVAHHIKPFAAYPDLRFAVSNGITLCQKCHDALHYG